MVTSVFVFYKMYESLLKQRNNIEASLGVSKIRNLFIKRLVYVSVVCGAAGGSGGSAGAAAASLVPSHGHQSRATLPAHHAPYVIESCCNRFRRCTSLSAFPRELNF